MPYALLALVLARTLPALALIDASDLRHAVLVPTASPTVGEPGVSGLLDPWPCYATNATKYADVPQPTGALLSAIQTYGQSLIQATCTEPVGRLYYCAYPASTRLCGFSSVAAAPSASATMLAAYSGWASSASSFWAAHSSAAVDYAHQCPNSWWELLHGFGLPGADFWLNTTLVYAGCYAVAHPAAGPAQTTASGPPAPTVKASEAGRTGAAPTSAPTTTAKQNSGPEKARAIDMLFVAGTGLAVAATAAYSIL